MTTEWVEEGELVDDLERVGEPAGDPEVGVGEPGVVLVIRGDEALA